MIRNNTCDGLLTETISLIEQLNQRLSESNTYTSSRKDAYFWNRKKEDKPHHTDNFITSFTLEGSLA